MQPPKRIPSASLDESFQFGLDASERVKRMTTKIPSGVNVPGLGSVRIGQKVETLVPKNLTPVETNQYADGSRRDAFKLGGKEKLAVTIRPDGNPDSVQMTFNAPNGGVKGWLMNKLFDVDNAMVTIGAHDGVVDSIELQIPNKDKTPGKTVAYELSLTDADRDGKVDSVVTTRGERPKGIANVDVMPTETQHVVKDLNGDGAVDAETGSALPKSPFTGDWLVK